MTQESAVQFQTTSRIHMGLPVQYLDRSVAFYRTLFGQEPTKTRRGYAKFEVAEPPVNLSLNQVGGATGPNNPVAHFGIQVKSTEAVQQVANRFAAAGVATEAEESVTCCYAVQNKVWAVDPDGNKWEVYVVLDDDGAHHRSSSSVCCAEAPAIMEGGPHASSADVTSGQPRHAARAVAAAPDVGEMSDCGCRTAVACCEAVS